MGQTGLTGARWEGKENDEQLWENKGPGEEGRKQRKKKKEEEKERFGAEREGTGGGLQGRRKGGLGESGRERELRRRRRRWEGWAVGGRRQGEGLGGEQELGRLVVPVETGTRWRPGSSPSSSACIHSPARPKSRCSYCWQKARGCTKPLPDENEEPETFNSQDWFKLLQLTNDLMYKNGDKLPNRSV